MRETMFRPASSVKRKRTSKDNETDNEANESKKSPKKARIGNYELALSYYNDGDKQDYCIAKEYFEKAAVIDDDQRAYLYLAELYKNGWGVSYNLAKAQLCYKKVSLFDWTDSELNEFKKELEKDLDFEEDNRPAATKVDGLQYFPFENIIIRKFLCSGGAGAIFLGDLHTSEKEVAKIVVIKRINPISEEYPPELFDEDTTIEDDLRRVLFKREGDILAKIQNSPLFINCYGMSHSFDNPETNNYYFVMEYAENGDFNAAISSKQLSLQQCYYILTQIAEGLAYLHARYIFHNDIKAQNIVLDSKLNGKIIDFSEGKELPKGSKINERHNHYSDISYFSDLICFVLGKYPGKPDLAMERLKIIQDACIRAQVRELDYHIESSSRIHQLLSLPLSPKMNLIGIDLVNDTEILEEDWEMEIEPVADSKGASSQKSTDSIPQPSPLVLRPYNRGSGVT